MAVSGNRFVACRSVLGHRPSSSHRATRSAPIPEAHLPATAPAKDLKAARQAFKRGLKFEEIEEALDQALYEFQEAARLVPQNVEYLTATEMTRQHLAGMHLEQGNSDLFSAAARLRRWRNSAPR
jgi:hypothetical protein